MFRILYAEESRVRLVETSYAMWHEMEDYTDLKILNEHPLLFFGHPGVSTFEGSITAIRASMEKLGIPIDYLSSPDEIAKFAKVFKKDNMPADYVGLVQNNGATINVMNSFSAFTKMAVESGVAIHANTLVDEIAPISNGATGYELKTATGAGAEEFHAGHIIVCPGMWLNKVLSTFRLKAYSTWKIQQMTLAFFNRAAGSTVDWPIWYEFGNHNPPKEGLFYGFPDVGFTSTTQGKFKISCDYTNTEYTDPKLVSGYPDQKIISDIQKHLRLLLADGVLDIDHPTLEQACCYSTAPDGDMVIGKIPLKPEVEEFYANASLFCMASGRGFKFTPLWGRVLASLALDGKTAYDSDLVNFRTTRPNIFQSTV